MRYRYEVAEVDRSDFSSGWVLQSRPGFPAFPVRLGSEVFQQLLEIGGWTRPVSVWDPLCGSGYLLTSVALLHRRRIARVLASDVDPTAVELAAANLDLLAPGGLERRAREVGPDAAESARRLATHLKAQGGAVPVCAVVANALDPVQVAALARNPPIDVVITDVPYGVQTQWSTPSEDLAQPLARLVENLSAYLAPGAVIGVAGPRVRRLDDLLRPRRHLRIGKRSVLMWRVEEDLA